MELIQPLLDRYVEAILHKDIEGLMSLYHPDVTMFNTYDFWCFHGARRWCEAVTHHSEHLLKDVTEVTFRNVQVKGKKNVYLVHGLIDYHYMSHPDTHVVHRFTWLIKRAGDDLKIIHQHTSLPIDPSTNYFLREMP